MIAWLGDFLRLWWGLLYWNVRKAWFRLQRGRARCPCQNASDSGRALETGCDAAQMWHRPSRFRRVCPLLVETPGGLRCSVDARNVRPFWARAAAYYATAAGSLYLAGVVAVFVLLRGIGYPLSPLTVAWPPRWPQLRIARSAYFGAKAREALAGHHVNEAILSLEIAYRNNPRNYGLGFELAQLMAVGQPLVADRLFAVLMHDHPDQRAATAETWYRWLLLQGRFVPATALAADRVVADAGQRSAWLHALFFLTRHTHDNAPLQQLVARHAAALNPIDVAVINSELLIRQGQGFKLLPGLTSELPPGAGAFGAYYQVSRLVALGRPAEATVLLNRYAANGRLGDADVFRLRLDLAAALGRQDLLRDRLRQGPITARELELISVHLVRHPDGGALDALAACLERSPLPPEAATYAGYSAYLMACGVAGDWTRMRGAAAKLNQLSGARLPQFDAVEAFFKKADPARRLENILPSLPGLSVDMVYALYDRYGDTAPAVAVKLSSAP